MVSTAPPRLLITDDDRAFRETLRSIFERRGLETVLAADGLEALDILQREAVHLLLVDMHMPRLDGLETIRRMQSLAAPPPSILISAALDEAIVSAAQRARVFSVLAKPVSFQQVTGAVDDALRRTYAWDGGP